MLHIFISKRYLPLWHYYVKYDFDYYNILFKNRIYIQIFVSGWDQNNVIDNIIMNLMLIHIHLNNKYSGVNVNFLIVIYTDTYTATTDTISLIMCKGISLPIDTATANTASSITIRNLSIVLPTLNYLHCHHRHCQSYYVYIW